MPAPNSLQRLVKIRVAEEKQKQAALAKAIQELHRLQNALTVAHARTARGRAMINGGALSGKLEDRIAGCEEASAADRAAKVLTSRVHAAEESIERLQADFLAKRVQRRQVQCLLESAIAEDGAAENRKSQAAVDEWHRSRRGQRRLRHSED